MLSAVVIRHLQYMPDGDMPAEMRSLWYPALCSSATIDSTRKHRRRTESVGGFSDIGSNRSEFSELASELARVISDFLTKQEHALGEPGVDGLWAAIFPVRIIFQERSCAMPAVDSLG